MGASIASTPHTPDPNERDRVLRQALGFMTQACALVQRARDPDYCTDPAEQVLLDAIAEIDSSLPGAPDVGTKHHAGMPIAELSATEAEKLIRRRDTFSAYKQAKECFTDEQWVVVCMYYRDGLTEERIAQELGITRNAVYDRRRRARTKKEADEKERLAERVRVARFLANP